MSTRMKITRKQALPFIEAADMADYTGRKISVEFTETVPVYNTNWDGGSRNYYSFLNMETSTSRKAPDFAPWENPIEGQRATLKPGRVIVERCFYCGSDLGITIYAHPDQAKFLTAGM